MKHLLMIFGVLLLCISCRDKEDEGPTTYRRTVLVYMAADNDLSDESESDLYQMMEGSKKIGREDRLLLFVDNQQQKPFFMLVENGDTTRLLTMNEELRTSKADVLHQAMQWAVAHYPATSYGLVLWGHASGWEVKTDYDIQTQHRAYGVDKRGGTETWMELPDLAEALTSLPKLTFLFADCCCFQCIESCYELRHCTDYIISSAAEIPGEGAPYHTVVPAMFSQSECFYEEMVDAYFEQRSYGYLTPLSVVATAHLDQLATTTGKMLSAATELSSSDFLDVQQVIYYYDYAMFDMKHFMQKQLPQELYDEWLSVFEQVVVYKKMTTKWMANHIPSFSDFSVTDDNYGGVSMFVRQNPSLRPDGYRAFLTALNNNINRMQWYRAAGLDALGW